MIRQVIKDINSQFTLSYEDKKLGIVYPVLSKTQWLPGADNGLVYDDAIPDSSKKSILYWEDMGSRIIDKSAHYMQVGHLVRLIVWMNFNKIQGITYDACVKEIALLKRKYGTTLLVPRGQVEKKVEIFSRYDYLDVKQYITYPYEVAAFDYEIKFMVTCG